ncbi:MAG: NFACT RNA binding domain-containing protein [archaeon]|nr:NFACT RNA binding domain-containing protein [archaeon]
MKVDIDFLKSLEENANAYYAEAKKAKKKLLGLEKGVAKVQKKIAQEHESGPVERIAVRKREKRWFEKFHWFFTSEGLLVIAGRDARSNEDVVKKHMEKNDVYFHADVHGAPHTVLKAGEKKPGKKSLAEAAIFAAVFSKAWREQLAAVDVYSASPSQVSKNAPSGESLGTGAFMVYGEREWFRKTPLEYALGFAKKGDFYEVFGGPLACVEKCELVMIVVHGKDSKGNAAKKALSLAKKKLGSQINAGVDDISNLLPSGELGIKN